MSKYGFTEYLLAAVFGFLALIIVFWLELMRREIKEAEQKKKFY